VASFLSVATEKLSAGALGRRAAAIADQHRRRDRASPGRRSGRARRSPGGPPTRKARVARHLRDPANWCATTCPGDLAGRRDRALLLLMAGGFGRTALVGLDVEQLRFIPAAVELTLPGDPVCEIPCGANPGACPVQALWEWLRASIRSSSRCSVRSMSSICQSALNIDPLSASKIDPVG
jgi:hypothetical protein